MTSQTPAPLELFYSYSHKDEDLRDQLEEHLAMLKREGVITGWHDRRISGGQEWVGQIDGHLDSADIILLLTSSAFLASDYCYDVEVKRALERHEAGDARVIPVILRACDWNTSPFGKLQALPKDGMPVKQWPDPDVAFLDIAKGIRRVAEEISARRGANAEELAEPSGPDPYLPIPDLRVNFVPRKDKTGNDIVKLLREDLSPQRPRLVALWGAGGVGKTAIASETVRGLIEPFAKRIAWVSADGLDNFGLSTLLDTIAAQLGSPNLRTLPLDLKKDQVRDLVRIAPTLVVLDNFETIEPAEGARCVEWLGRPAPCSALITTRDVIEGARDIPIEVMQPEEANALLDQLIDQAHDARAFIKLDRKRLIQTAEANPLVLQWIVGQIDLAQDPDEVLDDLRHGEGSAAERVFNRSFELKQLNNGGRAVLLALSLFAPSSTRKGVAEVSGLGKDNDRKKFKNSVRSLSALWLIHTVDESSRLAVEGLTRELTKARLNTDPRAKIFRPRFILRFLQHAESHREATFANLNALEAEKDNILAAMDIAYDIKDWVSVVRLMGAINYDGVRGLLTVRGYWDEAIFRGEQAIQAARALGDKGAISGLSGNVAILRMYRGEYDSARRIWQQSLEAFRQIGEKENVAVSLNHLGILSKIPGDWAEARRLFTDSLSISEQLADDGGISNSLLALGSLSHNEGELAEARRLFERCLEIRTRLLDQAGIASTLNSLGTLSLDEGKLQEAERLFDQSLGIQKKLGELSGIASSLFALGRLAHDRGELGEARRLYSESLAIEKKLGHQGGIANGLLAQGNLEKDYGELREAHRLYAESLKIQQRLGDRRGIASSLHQLGVLSLEEKNYPAAEKSLQESLEILHKLGDQNNRAECLESIGNLLVAQGRVAEAKSFFDEALGIAEKLRVPFRVASVKRSVALSAEKEANTTSAGQLLREALEIFEELRSPKAKDARQDLERVEGMSS